MTGVKLPGSNIKDSNIPAKPRRLIGKSLVWPYLFLVLALVVVFVWGYANNQKYVIETYKHHQQRDAQLVAVLLSSTISNVFQNLGHYAEDPDVIIMSRKGKDKVQQILSLSDQEIVAATRISSSLEITYTFPDESAIGTDLSSQPHNQKMAELQEGIVSSPFMDVQGYEAVSVAVPVFSNGKFKGSLAVLMDFLTIVENSLILLDVKDARTIFLMDSKGVIIYSPIRKQVGCLGSDVFANNPEMLNVVNEMQACQTGTAEVSGGLDPDRQGEKKAVLVAFSPAMLTNNDHWSICIVADQAVVLENLSPTKQPFIVAALFALLVLFITFTFARVSGKYKKILEQDVVSRTSELQVSEEKHRVLIESLSEGIVVTDAQGFIDLVNPAMERILEKPTGEIHGTKLSDYLSSGQLPKFLSQQALLQLGHEITFGIKTITQSGELRDLLISAKPNLSSTKKYLGATLFIQDFTKRKQAEDLLKMERQVFLGGPVVVFKWTNRNDEPVEYVSPNVTQFGYSVEQWLSGSVNFQKLIHPDDFARVKEEIEAYNVSGVKAFEQEYRIVQGNDQTRWVYDFTTVIRDDNGEITHFLGYLLDTTEVKRASLTQELLLDISETHSQTMDLETMVGKIRDLLGKLIDTTNFYVALFDPAVGLYSFPYAVDEKDQNFKPQPLRFSLTDYVRRTGEPLFSTEEVHKQLVAEGEIQPVGPTSPVWLGAPLKSASGVFGVVAVQNYSNPKNYEPADLELLAYVSDHIAQAIERNRAETALSKSEESYRKLVEVAQESIITVDENEIITFANGAFCEAIGFDSLELLGQSLADLADSASASRMIQGTKEKKLGRIESYEIRLIAKNGEYKDFLSTSSPLAKPDGTYQGSMAVMVNITERKKSEDKMLHTQKLESLGVLASGIAHDFSNLLVGILGNSGLALGELDESSRAHTYIVDVEKSANRAADLTQQLLAYSGKGKFSVGPTDLCELVTEMGELLGSVVKNKVSLKYNLDESVPPIQADAVQIRQVIMNIILNAAESVSETDGIVLIKVGKQQADSNYLKSRFITGDLEEGEYAFVEVSDNGFGMDKETLSKIFDPFYTTKLTGRGLGLAAVLGIIRRHRGTIRVYSKIGQGSSFKFLLPLENVQAAPPEMAVNTIYEGTGNILLIDDEPTIRRVGSLILSKKGYEIVCAADGIEGLKLFKADPDWYDLVVLDLSMPTMSGEEVLEELHGIKPGLRVIITSGFSEMDFDNKFSKMNNVGFLPKPFSQQVLLEHVGKLLKPHKS